MQFDSLAVELAIVGEDKSLTPIEKRFIRDTMNMCRWFVEAPWKEKTSYRLYIPKEKITDVMGYKNDSTVVEFATFDPEKFATVTVKVSGTEGKEYILLLTNSSNKTLQEKKGVTSGEYRFNFVEPGEIRIRVIEDANGNGVWDAGDVLLRRQPERAEIYMNDRGEEVFTTKMNWDFEINIDMTKLFKPMTMENIVKLLEDKEEARLKLLYEEWLKKQGEPKHDEHQSSGGGMGLGGAMGGLGGLKNTIR